MNFRQPPTFAPQQPGRAQPARAVAGEAQLVAVVRQQEQLIRQLIDTVNKNYSEQQALVREIQTLRAAVTKQQAVLAAHEQGLKAHGASIGQIASVIRARPAPPAKVGRFDRAPAPSQPSSPDDAPPGEQTIDVMAVGDEDDSDAP